MVQIEPSNLKYQIMKRITKTLFIMWLCQVPSRFYFYMKSRRLVRMIVTVFVIVFYCEFIHYYLVLLWCVWPALASERVANRNPLRAMFIGDTHILGSDAHWFDKLRREWQMVRSFQATMLIHSPDVVFILGVQLIYMFKRLGHMVKRGLYMGDLLDNGKDCSKEEFNNHVERFKKMFSTPLSTKTEIIVGNHDVGFHYMMSERKHERFVTAFDSPSVRLLQIKNVLFVLVNSMALEGDGCHLCNEAEESLRDIKWKLKCAKGRLENAFVASLCQGIDSFTYSRPILLQHFPMYRESDMNCSTPDAAPDDQKSVPFREKWDCISRESTAKLFDMLDPRLIVSAHTHHGCYRLHENRVPEYTVASYNWRNKQNPTFMLASISDSDFSVNRCYLPNEMTVVVIYVAGAILLLCLSLPVKTFRQAKDVCLSTKLN